MPPKRPEFRYRNKTKGELIWICTERAKEVANNIQKMKKDKAFGPQLTKEQELS